MVSMYTNKLHDFYTNNVPDYPKIKKKKRSLLVCSYNVHGWVSINPDVYVVNNFNNIVRMISKYKIDVLVLQEVSTYCALTLHNIIEGFTNIGYKYSRHTYNGDIIGSYGSRIMIFSKYKIKNAYEIDVTIHNHTRKCIYAEIDKLSLVAVHLEIGDRYHYLLENSVERRQIEYNNNLRRLWQLQKIFSTFGKVNIIVGDYNFTEDDAEFKYITKMGYVTSNDKTKTNPFNRTDYIFLNDDEKNYKLGREWIIKCNFSDHLPVIGEIIVRHK